jgi:hypothetical protein
VAPPPPPPPPPAVPVSVLAQYYNDSDEAQKRKLLALTKDAGVTRIELKESG